ncbi:MAG: thiamine pyrophosphate-dependent enzyme, partial [Pseudomonadota bacterium]
MNEALSNPLERLHEQFLDCLQRKTLPLRTVGVSLGDVGLDREQAIRIFESQLISRQLDRIARIMQARGQGFYTIGSAGHEGMAGIAAAFRLNDMAFLHYRDASFLIQRARMAGFNPMRDLLLSFMAAKADPIAGGRHKVLGHKDLFIPPQTSTIASHLPKAVGAAFSIGLARKLRPKWQQLDDDGVILCSFGDASLGHASAQSALNTASWTAFQAIPMPILFICEDNGIGISTPTPAGWIKASCMNRPGLHYLACDGLDLAASWQAASIAERIVRRDR